MGRGKKRAPGRERGPALSTADGRVKLAPRMTPEPPGFGVAEAKALYALLEQMGVPAATLTEQERAHLGELWLETEGPSEERCYEAADAFIEELYENEEETEPCDRCQKIVRAGQGSYFPPEGDPEAEHDQQRLCQSCYDQVEADAKLLRKFGADTGN